MFLESRKPITEVHAAAPALHITFQVALPSGVPPSIVPHQWEDGQVNKERCGEGIVVFSVLKTLRETVNTYDVNVQVVHGRGGVDSDSHFLLPVSATGQWLSVLECNLAIQNCLALLVLSREGSVLALEFLRNKLLEFVGIFADRSEELGVFEGLEWVHSLVFNRTG